MESEIYSVVVKTHLKTIIKVAREKGYNDLADDFGKMTTGDIMDNMLPLLPATVKVSVPNTEEINLTGPRELVIQALQGRNLNGGDPSNYYNLNDGDTIVSSTADILATVIRAEQARIEHNAGLSK